MSSRKKARQWARLRMLCCSGLDVMTIAPDALAVARELVPSVAPALFLTTHEGEMRARHHEDCPDRVTQLCIEGGELFEGPREPTFSRLYRDPEAPKVGQMLTPPSAYYMSNTYHLLIRGCGVHHSLDARLDVNGQHFGMLWLFREEGIGFNKGEADEVGRIAMHFEHALRASRPAWDEADRAVEQEAMLVANARGELLYASQAAQALLNQIPLVRSQWPDRRKLPPVCLRLIDVMRDDGQYPWRMPNYATPVPGGAIEMRAQWLGPIAEEPDVARSSAAAGLVGIVLTWTIPMSLRVLNNLNGFQLSPTQMEVAYWMAMGGGREAAREQMAISEAVLRDSVKVIYEKLRCASQADLVATLRAPAYIGEEGDGRLAATDSIPASFWAGKPVS